MKVILLKDVDNLGRIGDVKEVARGYARNYLLPKGMVVEATAGQMKRLETLQRLRAKSGLTMILVEQNLDFIAALSQRILIIQKGAITREVAPAELGDASLVGEFVGIAT